jgi:hypothetical protein
LCSTKKYFINWWKYCKNSKYTNLELVLNINFFKFYILKLKLIALKKRIYIKMLAPPEIIKSGLLLLQLWKNECTRVISDRLNDIKDKIWFDENIQKIILTNFGNENAEKVKNAQYFVNFLRPPEIYKETGEPVGEIPKIYFINWWKLYCKNYNLFKFFIRDKQNIEDFYQLTSIQKWMMINYIEKKNEYFIKSINDFQNYVKFFFF